jgi:protein O-GlcNAc transferase
VIALNGGDAMIHIILGRLRKGQNRFRDAEDCYRTAIHLSPQMAEPHVSLGIVLKAQGRIDEAMASYEAALRINPNFPEAQVNLANALRERGLSGKARRLYREAAAKAPHLAEAQSAIAASMLEQGRKSDAIERYRRALAIKPNQPQLHFIVGCLLVEAGQSGTAEAFSQAVHYQPHFPDAWSNLGTALTELGRKYEGVSCFERAIEQEPDHLEANMNLAMAVGELGDSRRAETIMLRMVEMHPHSAIARKNLGVALMWARKVQEAEVFLREASDAAPEDVILKILLAMTMQGAGRQHQGNALIRDALKLNPNELNGHSNLLLGLCYADQTTAQQIVQAAQALGKQPVVNPEQTGFLHEHLDRNPSRRLRIGYVSPDFRAHSVAYFLMPVMSTYDREAFDVFCYSNHPTEDAVCLEIKSHADHWFNCYGLTEDQLASKIREDRIDILVDLAGHTAHGRLLTFARKPAPVQMAWLGFPSTNGIPAIDYRVTDWQVDPQGYERYNTEIPLRMPASYFCYRPGPAPEVAALPALSNDFVTFGSFNVLAKISDQAIALWSRVLHAVPRSRLLLKAASLGEAATRERIVSLFAAQGIETARLDLVAWSVDTESHLATYHRVDIGLDSFPYNGATTTCEALWMGVPVVSFCGETHAARMGRSILNAAGLGELVAESEDDFLRTAVNLAADTARLAQHRASLREQLRASSLMDEATYTRALETLYRQAWQTWCAEATSQA